MKDIEKVTQEILVGSPFARLLGLRLEAREKDFARMRLPFREAVTTLPEWVHGGAIASLIDTVATVAAWSGADPERTQGGTTVGYTVNYLNPSGKQDLIGHARVIQRGRSLCVVDVEVRGARDEASIARALVTYKIRSSVK